MAGKPPPIQRDWWAKSIAGTLLGFTLGILASGLLVRFGPALPLANTAQLAMWTVPPVWMAVLSLCFLFQTGLRAWVWLLAINLLPLAVLLLAGPRPA